MPIKAESLTFSQTYKLRIQTILINSRYT